MAAGKSLHDLDGKADVEHQLRPDVGASAEQQWPHDPTFAAVTLYGLRQSAATLMLRSGVVPAEVARRLGHSADVLMRTYAGVLEASSIARISRFKQSLSVNSGQLCCPGSQLASRNRKPESMATGPTDSWGSSSPS